MNEYIVEAHLEMHRHIMSEVKKKVPAKRTFYGRELTLSNVTVDEDGILMAKYSRYRGCGEYDTEDVHLRPDELFTEEQ